MSVFGLIGKKLGHSFSKGYFEKKFDELKLETHKYRLFELDTIEEVTDVFSTPKLKGLNVTVPYKEAIMPYLDRLDDSAKKVGAVNVVKIVDNKCIGYNSDYYGFKTSLINWLDPKVKFRALVLGTGGASKAVTAALHDLKIPFGLVSRDSVKGDLTYEILDQEPVFIEQNNLIINTTPLGMHPSVHSAPDVPYSALTAKHYLYDLVYNPEITLFLSKGKQQGATIKNGLEMLHLQAEKSWEIWS